MDHQDRCQRCGYRLPCECKTGPLLERRAAVDLAAYRDPMFPSQVAEVFGVDAKTVTRWAKAGRIPSLATPGGHRQYRKADVQALLNGGGE